METINEDKWGEEVWGAATSPGTNSRDTAHSNLILYWGKNVSHHFQWNHQFATLIFFDRTS
jgi:anaerobic selenocysteine-containing dehydrogenase